MTRIRTEFPYAVRVIENLWIPLPDGTRLAAKAWLPEGAGRVPAVLEYLPYRKRDGTRTRDQGHHMYLAGHGYAGLRVDIRGTGDSDGLIDDEYTETEQRDGCDVIAWIAAQDWCCGQVAMIGISWGGFNGLQIAARRPPALATVITVGSTDDRYATDVHWIGGCLSKDNFDWSATMFAHQDLPPDPAIVGARWRPLWEARREANRPWILTWLAHQRRDAYWRQGSVCEDFARIAVPVYAVSGWADNYSESVPRLLAGLQVPRLGLVGPWAHSYPHDPAVEPAIGWLQEVVRWCDHWMKGRDTGLMDQPMYRVWMQESVPPATCYRERPGRWVAEDAWPSPRIRAQPLALSADGRLGGGAAGERRICSPLWVGLAAGEIGRYGEEAEWPTDQREDDGGSLVWVSDPLPERLEILGAPLVRLRLSSDKPQALVAARLNDIRPDGRSTRVGLGLLNLTHRDGHDRPAPLEPGRPFAATVEMDDIAHAFPAGHRIGLALSTCYWPIAWPSPELATLTVDCAASALVLPVRPPRPEDADLAPFGPPEQAPDTPALAHPVATRFPRRVTRDLLSGRMTVDFPRWTSHKELTDISQTHRSEGLARYVITEDDPLSATCETWYRVEIVRPDATITHESRGVLDCDATHFRIRMEVVLQEDGREVFRRDWDERIPRDLV
jgi:putative CocE/NonD family hydrolase